MGEMARISEHSVVDRVRQLMKRECVAAEVSVAIEPKMELEEISTSVVGLKFSIEFRPQVAHRDKSQSPEFTVGIDAKADICGQAVSAEPAANDPLRSWAGSKSCSAAVPCRTEVCYSFRSEAREIGQ
jgi:hypothetical protein